MKKMISLLSAALLAVGISTTAFAADINVSVDGTPISWTDAKPFIDENSRTLVPLRPIANALGLEVAWDDDKNQASFTDGETTAVFTIGEKEYYAFLNETPDFNFTFETDTAAVIANSRTYAPARYLAECFQYAVGWNNTTQTVLITKATEEEFVDDTPILPEIPAGKKFAAEPMITEPGVTVLSTIALKGMVEEPDIFTYESVMESPIESNGHGLLFEDGYLVADFLPAMGVAPGTYTITWTLPGGWFEDGENIVVDIPLTVNKATVVSALAAAMDDLSRSTVFADEGATAEEINAEITEDFWLFAETPFALEVSGGTVTQDEYGEDYWNYNVTVTDTETGDSMSGTTASCFEITPSDW